MCKSLKAVFAGIYLATFLHSINYLLFYEKNDIVELNYLLRTPGKIKHMVRKLRKLKNNITITTSNFKRPKRFHTDLKYILNWNHEPTYHGSNFVKGQTSFLMNNCTYTNCYLTVDRSLLPDFRYFDAILFGVESDWDVHPFFRAYHQNYIFTTSESSRTYPICNEKYDNYYNLTWTYRLDSDIIKTKFKIMDLNANVIGPKKDMLWINKMQPTTDEMKRKLKEKKKAAAWFSNNCAPTSNLMNSLNESLLEAKLTLDSYGWCGKFKCPKNRIEECLLLLKKIYYFYFAFERSIAEDYVTEDLLYPLLNYAVPVVYGGADYSRYNYYY